MRDCQSITESCGVKLLSFGKEGGIWERGRWFRSLCTALWVPLHFSKEILVVLWNKLESTKENSCTWKAELYGGGAGGTERERAADIISPILSPPVCLQWPPPAAVPKSFECQLSTHKHSARAQRASPRRLSHFNSCVIAGDQPNCAAWARETRKREPTALHWIWGRGTGDPGDGHVIY